MYLILKFINEKSILYQLRQVYKKKEPKISYNWNEILVLFIYLLLCWCFFVKYVTFKKD